MNKERFKNLCKFKKNLKGGWTLVELCVAMIALAILVGISVQSIKPKRMLIAPFAYAGVQNLKQANNYILIKCNNNEVYGCRPNDVKLPDSTIAVQDMHNYWTNLTPEERAQQNLYEPTVNNIDDTYCIEVANLFTLVDETINCKFNNGNGDGTELPSASNGNKGKANFQASNMVSYYYLERPWYRIMRASPSEGSPETMNATTETYAKQIWIDVNGNDAPNKPGEDQFALKVYITGEIIPSGCKLYAGEKLEGADAMDTTHLYCPSGTSSEDNWLKSSYPFSYNLFRSYVPDIDDSETRKTDAQMRGVSYQEAACKSGRDILIPREQFCSATETPQGEGAYDTIENCETGEHSAFCVTRLSRPSNPGLFRLPIAI